MKPFGDYLIEAESFSAAEKLFKEQMKMLKELLQKAGYPYIGSSRSGHQVEWRFGIDSPDADHFSVDGWKKCAKTPMPLLYSIYYTPSGDGRVEKVSEISPDDSYDAFYTPREFERKLAKFYAAQLGAVRKFLTGKVKRAKAVK